MHETVYFLVLGNTSVWAGWGNAMHSAMALTRAYTLRGCAMSASDNGSGAVQFECEATVNGGEWYTARCISWAWEILAHSIATGAMQYTPQSHRHAHTFCRDCSMSGSDNGSGEVQFKQEVAASVVVYYQSRRY